MNDKVDTGKKFCWNI